MSQRPTPRTFIVAVGARTPVGLRAHPAAAAIRAGISRLREHPFMVDPTGAPFIVAMDRTLDVLRRSERMYALALSALSETLGALPPPLGSREVLQIFVALPELDERFRASDAAMLCTTLSQALKQHRNVEVVPITDGNAGGIVALERGLATIQSGDAECFVFGGVDSFIDADVLDGFEAAERLASPQRKWGFRPGEGAAMLAVCTSGYLRSHRLEPIAAIGAAATSIEQNRINTRSTCLGVGLAEAIKRAALAAGGDITKQYCDLDGERYREEEFAYAIMRLPQRTITDAVDYVAPADCWGSTGAATAPLLMMLPVAWHARGASPGPRPMIWCGSDNGRRGAAVLHVGGGGS